MKITKLFVAMLLVFAVLCAFASCTGNGDPLNTEDSTVSEELPTNPNGSGDGTPSGGEAGEGTPSGGESSGEAPTQSTEKETSGAPIELPIV